MAGIADEWMQWPPEKASVLLLAGVTSLVFWMAASAFGAHPDGAILGFSGAMFGVWGTNEKESRRRRDRRDRDDDEYDRDDTDDGQRPPDVEDRKDNHGGAPPRRRKRGNGSDDRLSPT